ncbi:Uncharacterised protein [Bordetella pertussis]|nr:Uncharacterised protein [Bordetella pertussis]
MPVPVPLWGQARGVRGCAWSHWNRLSAVSSAMPMPPAPTRPSTADSRTLMSQRSSTMDQNEGRICGQ